MRNEQKQERAAHAYILLAGGCIEVCSVQTHIILELSEEEWEEVLHSPGEDRVEEGRREQERGGGSRRGEK